MQLFPILLIAVLLAWDGGLRLAPDDGWSLGPWSATALACGPVLVLLSLTIGGMWWCDRRLSRGDTPGAVLAAERLVYAARWLILVNHGVEHRVRYLIGDFVGMAFGNGLGGENLIIAHTEASI